MLKVRQECIRVEGLRLFNIEFTKPAPVELYDQSQNKVCDSTSQMLKHWVTTLKTTIIQGLKYVLFIFDCLYFCFLIFFYMMCLTVYVCQSFAILSYCFPFLLTLYWSRFHLFLLLLSP